MKKCTYIVLNGQVCARRCFRDKCGRHTDEHLKKDKAGRKERRNGKSCKKSSVSLTTDGAVRLEEAGVTGKVTATRRALCARTAPACSAISGTPAVSGTPATPTEVTDIKGKTLRDYNSDLRDIIRMNSKIIVPYWERYVKTASLAKRHEYETIGAEWMQEIKRIEAVKKNLPNTDKTFWCGLLAEANRNIGDIQKKIESKGIMYYTLFG